jgi:superfamily I DNA/RNA helicase
MSLRGGLSFTRSLGGVPAADRRRARLVDAGQILDALHAITDARRFISYLRGSGGLSAYITESRVGVDGIELTTIHRAKGRQWPGVHLFGCEENQLPHRRALEVGQGERDAGEGLEAERRLAYVAFTRAQKTLAVHPIESAVSRFLSEAGVEPTRPYGSPAPDRRAGTHRRPRLPC